MISARRRGQWLSHPLDIFSPSHVRRAGVDALISHTARLLRARRVDGYAAGMLRPLIRLSLLVSLVVLESGCGLLRAGKARRRAGPEVALAESRRAPLAIGRVSLVNEEERFALIEANLAQSPPPGTILRTYRGNETSAELRATGVRRRPFLVADLVSGMPGKDELVVQDAGVVAQKAKPAGPEPASEPAPVTPPRWKRWLGFLRGGK
jgi:hypothetical protein